MTPKPPSKLAQATEKAQALLATKLVDIFPKEEKTEPKDVAAPSPAPDISDPTALDYVVQVLNRVENLPGKLSMKDHVMTQHRTELVTGKVTLRDYLGMVARELNDPFVLERTRKNAWKHCAKEYEKRIEKLDRVTNRLAYGVPGALRKFHAFMDEMTGLVDEGKRPHTQVLRDGIAVLGAIAHKHRSQHAEIAGEASRGANLEDFHFHQLTSALINGVCIDDKPIPDALPRRLAHELRHFKTEYFDKEGQDPSDDMMRAKDELEQHVDAYLRDSTVMTQEDYTAAFKDYKFRSVVDYMQSDMALKLIAGTREIASTLGLNVSVSSRGK